MRPHDVHQAKSNLFMAFNLDEIILEVNPLDSKSIKRRTFSGLNSLTILDKKFYLSNQDSLAGAPLLSAHFYWAPESRKSAHSLLCEVKNRFSLPVRERERESEPIVASLLLD